MNIEKLWQLVEQIWEWNYDKIITLRSEMIKVWKEIEKKWIDISFAELELRNIEAEHYEKLKNDGVKRTVKDLEMEVNKQTKWIRENILKDKADYKILQNEFDNIDKFIKSVEKYLYFIKK